NGERAGSALREAAGALVERSRDAGNEQRHRRDRQGGQIVEDLAIKERRSARKGVKPKGHRVEGRRDVKTVDEGQRHRGEQRPIALAQPLQKAKASRTVHSGQPIMRIAAPTCTSAMRAAKIHRSVHPVTRGSGTTRGVMAPTPRTTGSVTQRSAR